MREHQLESRVAPDACPHCGFKGTATANGIHDCRRCHNPLMPVIHGGQLQAWLPVHLGPYQLIAPLASGGMGCVFEGRDTARSLKVAVKVPAHQGAWDQSTKDRFDREICLLQSIRHPNIVKFLDRGKVAGHRYFVMEYVEGKDLL